MITTLTHGRVTWTDILKPTPDDIAQLSARYPQFHPLNLQDCLNEIEHPKLDHHDDYLFLVVQLPVWYAGERLSRPAEVDIFIARGTLVTSRHAPLKPLDEMYKRATADEIYRAQLMERGASPLLYALLNAFVDYAFPLAQHIDHTIRHIEENLFGDDTRHILNEIAIVRRELIGIRRILRPQLDVIVKLEQGNWPFIHEDLSLYWSDISDHMAQLNALLDEHIEVVGGLSDTIDTLASHRIDEVVRLLTIITVLTLPLTVLSTLFGMNVALPFAEHPLLFFIITGFGIVFTIGLVWRLRKRGWL